MANHLRLFLGVLCEHLGVILFWMAFSRSDFLFCFFIPADWEQNPKRVKLPDLIRHLSVQYQAVNEVHCWMVFSRSDFQISFFIPMYWERNPNKGKPPNLKCQILFGQYQEVYKINK